MLESKNTKTDKEVETMEKPLKRPAKRFVELPGGTLKRRPKNDGGPNAEHTQRMGKPFGRKVRNSNKPEKRVLGRPERKSLGIHRADLPTTPMAAEDFE